ncbi:MAG: winged helix-turn-helix domain-containing protein, partial [Myxococcota bacterium]
MSLLALVGCTVDLERRTIRSAGGVTGRLGAADARLLAFLAERPLETIDRDTLAAAAWPARSVSARAVDGAVRRLRAALGTAAHQLATVHGDGYRFVPADRPPTVTPTTPIPSRERPTRTPIPVSTGSLDLVQGTFGPFGGEPVPLTGTEARVMEVLADHLGQAVDRRHIARAVWGRGDHARALEKVVAGLRAKLGAGAIHTIRGA